GPVEEVVGMGVLEGGESDRETLVDRTAGHPVELVAGHLEQVEAALGSELERLTQAAVALGPVGDVDRGHRDACPQGLDDGVATGYPLGFAGVAALGTASRVLVRARGRL